ncbi:MAG TPA: tetratricopeptide repeat protein [Gammaproteobacteria bacterium]|jgi:lipopolysaccharide biosynthesis regulator YciM|nr:tetratricopeptide repeat protein [Gammaproteobacteria bacterium]
MPTEATFLLAALLIIAAASGFAFKIYSDRDRDLPPRISADYIRGLNLVLNRRTDEALELFVQMAKVDEDTLETHFALGHLFRRRGEIERAIRVHENLLARPTLNETQRHQAIFSLAEDYLGAGLFDRAEQLLTQLTDSPTLAEAALEKLVYIYEREQEWQKAIDAQRKLEMLRGTKSSQVAHYYCELAEVARASGNRQLAREHLKNAVRSESGALRGAWIRAALAQEEGDYAEAIALYQQVIAADRHFISEVLPSLMKCYREAGRLADLESYLQKFAGRDASLQGDLAFAAVIGNLTDSPTLSDSVERFVFEHPVLASLVNAEELKKLPDEQRHLAIGRIAQGLRQIAQSSARYRCSNCGYSTQRFIWHCPSCKLWETIRPIQSFALENVLS